MASNTFVNNKTKIAASYDQYRTPGTKIDPGPYIATVKATTDGAKLGRIKVYIPELGGPENGDAASAPQFWRTVSYTSPFYGTTNVPDNDDTNGKHSYGFWATPPDVGNLVLVVFANGDPDRGFYIASIPQSASHYMVPGIAGSTKNSDGSGNPPVTEFNEVANPDLANFENTVKPVHPAQKSILSKQGLLNDSARGAMTSSSQRESPSAVFGISTPGRPAHNSAYADEKVIARMGGHTLVMDDGDASGANKIMRFRTSGGHQIMLNDSDNIVYIANANGTVWIELGASDSLEVYSENEVNIHAKGNMNYHTDSTFNLHAGAGINMFTKGDIKFDANNINLRSTANTTLHTVGMFTLYSNSYTIEALLNANSWALTGTNNKTIRFSPLLTPGRFAGSLYSIANRVPIHEPYIRANAQTQKTNNTFNSLAPTPVSRRIGVGTAPGITPADIAAQPINGQQGLIKGLDKDPAFTQVYLARISKLESGTARQNSGQPGDLSNGESGYRAVNQLGYQGKYQFGAGALIDAGFVKPEVGAAGTRKLLDPNNWIKGPGLPGSSDAFLNSPQLQETAMVEYTNRNLNTLVKRNIINLSTSSEEHIAGSLAAAHLLGAGSTSPPLGNGRVSADANGTTSQLYYDKLYSASAMARKVVNSKVAMANTTHI